MQGNVRIRTQQILNRLRLGRKQVPTIGGVQAQTWCDFVKLQQKGIKRGKGADI